MKPITFKPTKPGDGYTTSEFKPGTILLTYDVKNPEAQLLLQIDGDDFYVLGVKNRAFMRNPGEDFKFVTWEESYPKDRVQEVERSDLPLFMDFKLDTDRFQKLLEKKK
jgi:hypothetical protein